MKCCITVNCYPFLQVGGGCFDSFWELDGEMFYCQSEAAPSDRGLTLFGKRAKLSPALAGTTARLPVTEGSSFGQHLTADGVLLLQPFTPIPPWLPTLLKNLREHPDKSASHTLRPTDQLWMEPGVYKRRRFPKFSIWRIWFPQYLTLENPMAESTFNKDMCEGEVRWDLLRADCGCMVRGDCVLESNWHRTSLMCQTPLVKRWCVQLHYSEQSS